MLKFSLVSIFSHFFLVSNHDSVIYIDFPHVAASNTATGHQLGNK